MNRSIFFVQYPYNNIFDDYRARVLLNLIWIGLILWILWVLIGVLPNIFFADSGFELPESSQTVLNTFTFTGLFVFLGVYFLIQRGNLQVAIIVYLLFLIIMLLPVLNNPERLSIALLLIPNILAGILLRWQGIGITGMLTIFLMLISSVNQAQSVQPVTLIPADIALNNFILIAVLISLTVGGFIFLNNILRNFALDSDSMTNINKISQFGQNLSNNEEISTLTEAIRFVTNQLGYSFARIYLFTDRLHPTQSIRLGLGVQQTIIDDDIQLGDASAITMAVRENTSIVITPASPELVRYHLLPLSQAGLVVPIIYKNSFIGVLDIQRENQTTFSQNEVTQIEVFTHQLAQIVYYNRSLSGLQSDLQSQQQMIDTLRQRASSNQLLDQENTIETWNTYIHERGESIIGYDLDGKSGEIAAVSDLPDSVRQTLEKGELSIVEEGNKQILRVPIQLGGRTLGAMVFSVSKGKVIDRNQINMLTNIANRLAVALENRRLFEQSQAQVERETKANEISNILLSSTDLQTVLDLAAENFNEVLGAIQTQIHLDPLSDL